MDNKSQLKIFYLVCENLKLRVESHISSDVNTFVGHVVIVFGTAIAVRQLFSYLTGGLSQFLETLFVLSVYSLVLVLLFVIFFTNV